MSVVEYDFEDGVKDVLSVLETIPVPGFEEVLGPLNAILAILEPDPLDEIKKGIDEANQKLDNMFNVIITALDANEIRNSVQASETGLYNLEAQLKEIYHQKEPAKVKDVRKIFVDKIKDEFEACCGHSTTYLGSYEESYSAITQSLAKFIGGFMFPIEQCQISYTIVVEAARKIQTFYELYPEKCIADLWEPFLITMNDGVNRCSRKYDELFKKADEKKPKSIAPIMKGQKFKLKLRDKDEYIYAVPTKKEKFSAGGKLSFSNWEYSFMKCDKSYEKAENDWQFTLINASDPDNDKDAKWVLAIAGEESKPRIVATSSARLSVGHKHHYYCVFDDFAANAPIDPNTGLWIVDRIGDGSLQFRLENIPFFNEDNVLIRENWGSLSLEDKDQYSQWRVIGIEA